MGRRIVDLHPEAIAEGREAREWYRSRNKQAEEFFRLALEQAIVAIAHVLEEPDPLKN